MILSLLTLASCCWFFLFFSQLDSIPAPTAHYANRLVLEEPDSFVLLWNYTDTDITCELQVRTTGWMGFGLSPNGGMDGANVAISWIDQTTGLINFTDRHIRGRSVLVNQHQNWLPVLVKHTDGYLITKFTRKIKICDQNNEDMDIPNGTPFVIFAYGTEFEENGDIGYHSFRGTKSVPLINSLNKKIDFDMTEIETADFKVDV